MACNSTVLRSVKKAGNAVDFLIVGQGLAGSLLAWTLLQQEKSVAIIDPGQINASRVAAGLINPVTGMRLVKSLKIKPQLWYAKRLYQNLEKQFDQTFLIDKPMLRLLASDKDRQQAKKRLSDPDYADFLQDIIPAPRELNCPLGLLKQSQTGYLKTVNLLNCLRDYFIDRQCLIESRFNYAELQLTPNLSWRNLSPRRIVFCQGHESLNNPWFRYLPLKPVKGEILTLQSQQPLIDQILNYGYWFLPLTAYQFKIGASFDRENITLQPSIDAKQNLLMELSRVYPALAKTRNIDHQVGIRPTTDDRHPFIGPHPKHPGLYIFNGFGAKGSLQIPYYARLAAQNLIHQQPLPAECDINRYA